MEEKPIMDERNRELPQRPCPCSLLAVLVPYQCPSPAHSFQPVRCFRPARGSTPARHFPSSVLLPVLSAPIRKKKVKPNRRQFEPFSGRKKSREASRTNGSARTGTKGNILLMVLERSQLSCKEQM
ncbi:hypothetical protein OUZ56_011667 [Daphnia magna]|uniref:Uncharacterized protein n=1 Tax=Daphnia magna TaxID=35525 RepID=A0ABQ9Z139_9CRUS|nr:hypothetical protein OUZ56_011667 [Daphnia magna]